MTLDPELLSILACPVCRCGLQPLPSEPGASLEGLVCRKCAAVYPVRDEIPVMLAEEAVPVREWERGMREADIPRKPS